MPAAARLGDKAQVASDAHGCPSCPHPAVGPITVGSPDVNINKKPAARLDDIGAHAVCCGPNNFTIVKGSPSVYVNGKPLARQNDKTKHCGGTGPIIEGSPDVLIDDGAASAAAIAAMKAAAARKIGLEQSKKNEKGKAQKANDKNPGTSGDAGGAGGAAGAGKGAAGAKKGPAGTGKGGKGAATSGDLGKDQAAPKKGAAKPAGAKPAEAKPAGAKPAETKPAGAKPAGAKPAETKPAGAKPAEAKPSAEKNGKEKSGAQWVARFPTSRSVDDLNDDFRPNVQNFLAALHKAGASVSIAATYRPLERAFLMHWCYQVADGSVAPGKVPAMAGVDIDWDHGDASASRKAAQAMVGGYDIDYPAALTSRHTARAAIDMNVSWSGSLDIVDGDGKTVSVGTPRNGVSNTTLHTVGASYGVHKLVKDHPHWSDNGH